MATTTGITCLSCAGEDWQSWRRSGQWRYVRCGQCRLVRIDPFPQPAELAQVFDEGYFVAGGSRGGYADYDADADLHTVNASARLDCLPSPAVVAGGENSLTPAAARPLLVDVGCASGYTLDEAVRRGWRGVGVEVSAEVAQRSRDKGHRVEASLADLSDLSGTVDAVCFFQVLEHLPDPVAALAEAARLLRPGGTLLCETWDGDSLVSRVSANHWQQLSPPSVLWVFDRPSARAMLAAAGLQPGSWRATSKVVSLGLVLGQLGASGSADGLAGRAVGRLRRTRVRYGLGDLVMFQARRP
jgi:SAM-dependent methyltransferase